MRKFYLIIASLFLFTTLFAQIIDTTKVKSVRYEWQIDKTNNDSTLTEILTEYESGIIKEEYPSLADKGKRFGNYFIYGQKSKGYRQKLKFDFYIMEAGNVYQRRFYDEYGNPDSLHTELQQADTLRKWDFKVDKKYRRGKKLEYLIDLFGTGEVKQVYKYNLFGKLKSIKHYKGSLLHKISNFKNGQLIHECFPQRKKRGLNYYYEYDKKGRLTSKRETHYEHKYYYAKWGVEKVEKIFLAKGFLVEYETYAYSARGLLSTKKVFRGKREDLVSEYHYFYE